MLAGLRVKRAIRSLLDAPSLDDPKAQAARNALLQLGGYAVPGLLLALEGTEDTAAIEAILADLADPSTLAQFLPYLNGEHEEAGRSVARVLAQSRRLNAETLLDLFESAAPETVTTRILEAHRAQLPVEELLDRIDSTRGPERDALFRLLRRLADESHVPALVRRLDSPDPTFRLQVVRTLALFPTGEAREGLVRCLESDAHREPRLAALEALMGQNVEPPLDVLIDLLEDPEMLVRNQAIEALVRLDRKECVPRMKKLLRSESADVRRAALEVLNEVGTADAIDELVAALRDDDWWVRARAGDALAGTPVPLLWSGLLPMVAQNEEEPRQIALDVLKRSRSPQLAERLLADLGQGGSRPDEERRRIAAVRALGELGDSRAIPRLVQELHAADGALRDEALRALEVLAQGPQADQVLSAVNQVVDDAADEGLRRATLAVVTRLSRRIRDRQTLAPRVSALQGSPGGDILQLSTQLESETGASGPSSGVIDPTALAPGDLLANRYRIMRQVGRGGFGVVVLAVDEMVRDEIILKFLATHVAGDPSAVERFKHELRYARKITHENVIRIYDIISFGGSLAISMEYFPSHSLAAELGKEPAEEAGRWLQILRQVCAGLSEAHRVNVVHRDLKPGNILINDEDQVKIVDFGLSAAANPGASRLTRSGLVMGTPTYMSPEQIRGGTLDGRSDIYSLGVLMYELFTGVPPYDGSDPMAILFQHLEGDAKPPRRRNENLSPELERLIQRAMAVEPAGRFPTATALSEALALVPELAVA